jgi:hypothetical protein
MLHFFILFDLRIDFGSVLADVAVATTAAVVADIEHSQATVSQSYHSRRLQEQIANSRRLVTTSLYDFHVFTVLGGGEEGVSMSGYLPHINCSEVI